MEAAPVERHIAQVVLELHGTGSIPGELLSDPTDRLAPDSDPRQEAREVVIDMLCCTIRTALAAASAWDVQRATELVRATGDRTLDYLRPANDRSRRSDDKGAGQTYG
ncbi:MAG: hypothetical protein JWO56_3541 [Acidobacteria bacterium]|jgi:hypothetical protein|nr:hypothetical protein [Acidobacteriota bacterium]MEA2210066.1 hypothetical protein [Solirubrobacteraceae bacterium]